MEYDLKCRACLSRDCLHTSPINVALNVTLLCRVTTYMHCLTPFLVYMISLLIFQVVVFHQEASPVVSSLHLVNFYFCHLPLSTNISQKYNADKTTRSRHLFRNSNIISCTRSVSSNSSDTQFCVQVDNGG